MGRIINTRRLSATEERRLRRHAARLTRGVYLESDGDPKALVNRVLAALMVAPGTVVTGLTSLALANVTLPDLFIKDVAERVHLMAASDQAARPTRLRRRDVTVQHRSHHCDDLAFRSLGVPTAPLSHAWVDAVRLLGHEQNWRPWESEPVFARGRFTSPTKRQFLAAVQLGDVLIRRDRPLTSIDELGACTDATKGPGMRLARAALARLRPRTDSLMESWLRLVVWDAGFPEPRVNHEIRFASGRRYLDLSWPESKIALEYHGRQHFEDADQAYQDFGRRAWLHDMGWTLVEAVHADLLDPSALLGRLGALRW